MLSILLIVVFIVLLLIAAAHDQFAGLIIPDWIFLVGNIISVVSASFFPGSLFLSLNDDSKVQYLQYWHGVAWGNPSSSPLALSTKLFSATLLWSFWYYSLICPEYRKLNPIKHRFILWLAKLKRSFKYFKLYYVIYILGLILISYVSSQNSEALDGLLSSLIGLAFGTALLWSIRISAKFGMGFEALGFADVLLIGMVGSWLGWQMIIPTFIAMLLFGILLGLLGKFLENNVQNNEYYRFALGPAISFAAIAVAIFYRMRPRSFENLLRTYHDYTSVFSMMTLLSFWLCMIFGMFVLLRIFRFFKESKAA